MSVTMRYRLGTGTQTLTLPNADVPVRDLVEALKTQIGSQKFRIKYGWPPKNITDETLGASLSSLGLHRETLTIEVLDAETAAPEKKDGNTAQEPKQKENEGGGGTLKDEDISVKLSADGYLVQRTMPGDNSCLFRALSEALSDKPTPTELRRMVANYIIANPATYTAVILDKPPERYCAWIQDKDSWGGDIELGIISQEYKVEICVMSVKDDRIIEYGSGSYGRMCVVVWTGVHYNRIVEVFDRSLIQDTADYQFDVVTWETTDKDRILINARDLCRKLKDNGHFPDLDGAAFSCLDCSWVGQGEKAMVKHAMEFKHERIREIEDLGP